MYRSRNDPGWTLIVPVKELHRAKTRLPGPPPRRRAVALALAVDTVEAARRCPLVGAVLVVTDDPAVRLALPAGTRVASDGPRAGLSAAVEHGALLARDSQYSRPIAVIAGDLPALPPSGLTAVLQAAGGVPRGVVADASGTGTVLLCATRGLPLRAAFEGASLAAHLRSGACDLTALAPPGLRRDVDTGADLTEALQLAPGRAQRTRAAAADRYRAGPLSRPPAGPLSRGDR